MIQQLLQIKKESPLKSYASTKAWAADFFQLTKNQSPFEKAIIGGFACQQFSFAFMAGYQAALEKMFPMIAPNKIKALCVSEKGGGHPKAIQTTLSNGQLNGFKTYITAGSEVEHLLVLCKTDQIVNGRPLLKLVHLPIDSQLKVIDFELSFMKEIKHGKLALEAFAINAEQVLDGDGYSQYTKPFRTLEDICVGAAYQAMLLRQAIANDWEEAIRDQILLNIYTLKNLLTLFPSSLETHLLLTANEQHFEKLLPDIERNIEQYSSEAFGTDWALNKKLISLAKKVKTARLLKARNGLFS